MASKGYYSLIQYCPDQSRLESANVGVVLFCPEQRFLRAKLTQTNQRLAKFFGRDSFDPDAVALAKDAIEGRLNRRGDELTTIEELHQFVATRANAVLLTPPRPMRVDDPMEDLEVLYQGLVGGKSRGARSPKRWAELDAAFDRSDLAGKIRRGAQVVLPVIGKKFVAPYAFQNGHLNLIKPIDVPTGEARALQVAGTLALEGDLLQKHPTPEDARLIAVPRFSGPPTSNEDVRRLVMGLFSEYKIRTVEIQDLSRLAQEIGATAH
jgi:hypothetical protein